MTESDLLVRAGRCSLAFAASVLLAYSLASLSQSVLVMAALERAGAAFSLTTRLHVISHDLVGLTFGGEASFGTAILIAFFIAIPVAGAAIRYFRIAALAVFPLAGAVAMAVILLVVQSNFFYNMTFMEGTRGPLGLASQLLAGALGGVLFYRLSRRGCRLR